MAQGNLQITYRFKKNDELMNFLSGDSIFEEGWTN
jgi:hypothetical protein